MKKCCFIVPYFGTLPNYFNIFLKSCASNPDYTWLIITDDKAVYNYPSNVQTLYMTFNQLQELIKSKFDFNISLEFPYKLCDYRPAYGYIFKEEIINYQFWGHCDLDIIIGNLNKFLTNDLLSQYDKFFCSGHMIIYKNTKENNRIFMSSYKGENIYKKVYSHKNNCWFDEEYQDEYNINRIFLNQGKKVYQEDLSLNIYLRSTAFKRVKYVGFNGNHNGHGYQYETYKPSLCIWDNGNIQRYILENDNLKVEDYICIHLQGRQFNTGKNILHNTEFKILPNSFLPLEVECITKENFNRIKRTTFCLHYWKLQWKYKKNRINKWIKILK